MPIAGAFIVPHPPLILPEIGCGEETLIANTTAAYREAARFPEILPDELDDILCTVDVLGTPERVDGLEDLDPLRYGIIVTHENRRGLLLPHLEGVNTPQKQLEIALQKAGISADEPYILERFEVVRHY